MLLANAFRCYHICSKSICQKMMMPFIAVAETKNNNRTLIQSRCFSHNICQNDTTHTQSRCFWHMLSGATAKHMPCEINQVPVVGRKRLRLVTSIRHLTGDVIMIFGRRSADWKSSIYFQVLEQTLPHAIRRCTGLWTLSQHD